MQLKKRMRAVVAVFAASMIGAMGLGFGASANAATGNPDLTKKGSITVHKYENPAWGKTADGREITDKPANAGKALDGVEFKIQPVNGLDLNKAEDWAYIKDLAYNNGNVTSGSKNFTLGTEKSQKTDNKGVTKFDDLAAGVYLVTEGNTGTHNVTKKAQPFFVSSPLPTDNEWLYDVHAYPKNTVSDKGKKILDDSKAFKVGDNTDWNISYTVPAIGAKETYTKLGIDDSLNAYLKYVSAEVTLGDEKLVENTDYTVTVSNNTKADNDTSLTQKVELRLNETGLAKVAAKKVLNVKLTTKITGLPADGAIKNSFLPIVNDLTPTPGVTPGDEPTPTPGDRPVKVGDLWLQKKDGANKQALEGAEFTVYGSTDCSGDAIDTKASDSTGKVYFEGLVLGKKPNTEPAESNTEKVFSIKETKAPAGYVLNTECKTVTVKAGKAAEAQLSIDNTKQTGPNLPLTGGTGQMLLTLGGVAVLAAAGGLTVKQVRRSRQSA